MDLIDRQAAIDALDKRFDSIPMNQTTEILLLRKDLRELPSAQPETHDKRAEMHACDLIDRQPSYSCSHENDTISRRMAIDAIFGRSHEIIKMRIGNLPSAQPQRKRGKWIRQSNKRKTLYGWYQCSECGAFCGGETNFCSECGADMREVDDGRPD